LQLEAVFSAAMLVSELVHFGIVGKCQILWLDAGDAEVHQRHFCVLGFSLFRFFLCFFMGKKLKIKIKIKNK